ncbi:MAG: conjugal transfer protein TraF [Pseudomonadota bacterium]
MQVIFSGIGLLTVVTVGFSSLTYAANGIEESYWQRQKDGWFWYRDPPAATKKLEPEKKPETLTDKQKSLADFEAMQKTLEELKKIAIMTQADGDIKAYMLYQQVVMNKSSNFADSWQRLVWTDPSLDYALHGRPTTNFGLDVYDAERKRAEQRTVSELAQTHGLFFFFRSDCPYCHRFAPVLKRFEQTYGIRVFPISLDGRGLPEFPVSVTDNGIAARLNVTTVPALYLATPLAKEIQPIGFGVMAESEIAERIHVLTRTKPGERF